MLQLELLDPFQENPVLGDLQGKTRRRLPEPLPVDPLGKRLCEVFTYRWQPIIAPTPEDATQKPTWSTITRYPLRHRTLWKLWQDAGHLVGVRFGHSTSYAMIDLDAQSLYHPLVMPGVLTSIRTALETIGIYRLVLVRSSWSGGLHLYLPLPEPIATFDLAIALKQCLEAHGFAVRQGQLEIFPNVKGYGKDGKFTEYNAHRLPLQPASGSVLLNDDLQPFNGSLLRFFQLWETAIAGQDLSELREATAAARANYHPRPASRTKVVEAWRQDLRDEIKQGWTGNGQTNHLLKAIACYGVVFEGLTGEALLKYVEETAIACPGYSEWCRHQAQIKDRVKDWAAAAEGYYWAFGTSPTRIGKIHTDIVPFNRQRSEEAQERIKRAVNDLEDRNELPDGITARMKAIASVAKCSFTTLQKYKELWYPKEGVMASTEGNSADQQSKQIPHSEASNIAPNKELHTKHYMKGLNLDFLLLLFLPFLVRIGEGQGRGEERFPQPLQLEIGLSNTSGIRSEPLRKGLPPLVVQDWDEVVSGIQLQIRRLNWNPAQVQEFIAEHFQGRRRAQLKDDELVLLLYRLQRVES